MEPALTLAADNDPPFWSTIIGAMPAAHRVPALNYMSSETAPPARPAPTPKPPSERLRRLAGRSEMAR
jgi:hypothetical protein